MTDARVADDATLDERAKQDEKQDQDAKPDLVVNSGNLPGVAYAVRDTGGGRLSRQRASRPSEASVLFGMSGSDLAV